MGLKSMLQFHMQGAVTHDSEGGAAMHSPLVHCVACPVKIDLLVSHHAVSIAHQSLITIFPIIFTQPDQNTAYGKMD